MSNIASRKSLETSIKSTIIKNSKRIREKHSNISEIVENTPKTLEIKKIYDLRKKYNNLYLMVIKNHSKNPKIRYFLTISLASQSSDLLVNLSREFVNKSDEIRLIQFSIHPKSMRVSLLALKELNSMENYTQSVELLNDLRNKFRQKLLKISN